MGRLFLFTCLFLLPWATFAQSPAEWIFFETERIVHRQMHQLRQTFHALREQSVLTPVLPMGVPIPQHAPRFSTRAGCVAALGLASVGSQQRLVCRSIIEPFPFKGSDPTPARLEQFPLPAFSHQA